MHWIDPDCLPEISGQFERFLLNPHGEADGMILADGAEVQFPPHLGQEVRAAVDRDAKAALRIFGVRPRQGDVFAAVAFETADGVRIIDNGPPKKHEHEKGEKPEKCDAKKARRPMTAEGVVLRALHGPRGETRGALLADGRIIRLAPHEASRFKALLKPDAAIAARGEGLVTEIGIVIEADAIGPDLSSLQSLGKDPKPKKIKHEKRGGSQREAREPASPEAD